MTAAWPGTVTQEARADSYTETTVPNRASFQPDVGPPKLRRRTSMRMKSIRFDTDLMSFAAYEDFITFWRDTLLDGTQPFTRKHPRNLTGSDVTMVFKDSSEPEMRLATPTQCFITIDVWVLY